MSNNIFKKAKRAHFAGMITIKGIGTKEYYQVIDEKSEKEHQVTIYKNQEGTHITCDCDCTHKSLKSQYLTLCSHEIAVILFICGKIKIR
jgi:uncharacterized metal-binding protein YceD (DUF177 family)